MGTASNVQLGPGLLYVAATGTTEPTSASAVLPTANWYEVGYTEDGSTFTWSTNVEPIEVEEEFDPLFYKTTGRTGVVAFEIAEVTRRNLSLAINSGAGAANTAQALEPPTPGSEVRVALAWTSDAQGPSNTASRWIFRQVFQGGEAEIGRKKSPDKSLISVEFNLEKPTGLQPWKVFPNADGLI